ncbi:hypothetical protein [Methylobacterium nodulans]|uniref:Uncharacterized protein n=1 Tax=Methylobacterium nodulans (strain LMG 21967 / CNCM I-2342 / ORS 2060) TaxID=460265 RepID=B8IBY5_METNO|nr:hypothetical protein [Methylobacterium nodulans]ACL61167.1 conserved hypothetical protein [Methylobacterium nodulans ORS 2060]
MAAFFLYFTACLAGAPESCEMRRLPLDVDEARICLRLAQPQLARWIGSHPEYRITEWRCGAPPRDRGRRV